MKHLLRKKGMVFLLLVLSLNFFSKGEEAVKLKVRIRIERANVRFEASQESTVLAQVTRGQIFDSSGKTGEWYHIFLPQDVEGNIISGYIHQDSVEVIKTSKQKQPVETKVIKKPAEKEISSPVLPKKPTEQRKIYLSIGPGYGIPYGILGVNCEFNPIPPATSKISNYTSLTLGFGYFHGGIKYIFGIRGYPLGRNKKWQPRISVYYGTNGFYKIFGDYKNSVAPSFGGGIVWMVQKNITIDLEIQYRIINVDLPYGYYLTDKKPVTLSMGVQWNF